jgi:hypothetical protein
MRYTNIIKIAWLPLLLGLAFAQGNTGTQKDSTSNYRNREQYKYQEHVRNQGDTIQIQTTKSVENPAVQSEMTIEKTIFKDGNNVVKIEKTVITPKDTVTIQKEVGSATRDTVRTRECQRIRNNDSGCDGTPDTLRVREREHLRLRDGSSSGKEGMGTGLGSRATQRGSRRRN